MASEDTSISARLTAALDDLRTAAEGATGDVRDRIEEATQQIRQASTAAASRAQETASQVSGRAEELRAQLETFRAWIRGATLDILDEIQAELDRRREQIMGGGGPTA
jgi:chromosome segregation ATPase